MTPRAAGVVLLLAATAAIVITATAFAAHGGPRISSRIGGLVLPHKVGKPGVCNPCGFGKLVNHGGPTMTTNKVYTVFWQPSGQFMQSGYQSTINQFFQDVSHDSGMPTNVYAATTQYSGIQYASTYGGTYTDTTTAFPSNGCTPYGGGTVCLSDTQLQTEINHVITVNGWTKNGTNMFFIFTPRNVESCSQGSCTFTTYCAYHGAGSGGLIYANQPYTVTTLSQYTGACNAGQSPNGNDADSTINVTSHEHNEAITDPQLNAWYDNAGYENGDKCAWYFGSVSGPNGAEYNQTINGHHYYLQLEFSNDTGANGGCVQTHPIVGGGGNGPTITSFNPTAGPVGTPVDIQGTNFTGATSVKFNGTPDTSYVVNSSSDISAHVPTGATSGFITVTTPNGTGTSSTQFAVQSASGPTVTSFTPQSGPVGTNVSITGTGFTGATQVTFNGTQAVNFTVNSDTSMNANVPGGATTGPIAVTNGNGTGQSSTNFTVTTSGGGAPTITGFTPTQGFQGTVVTITGTNFTGATSVKLGTTPATFTVVSSTTIKATTPNPHFLGSYRWSVTTPNGTATSTSYFRFL